MRNIDNNDVMEPACYADDIAPIVRTIRRFTDAPVVLGGAALGVMPEALLRATGLSLAVLADGESVFPRVLESIASGGQPGRMPGVGHLENGVFRTNACAATDFAQDFLAPDYGRWLRLSSYLPHMASVPIQTKIGCEFQCVYCTYRKIDGTAYRLADPDRVADAVVRLAASGLRDVEIVDSVFNAPYDHARSVCESLAGRRHGARIQSLELNPAYFDDALLQAMERAGFAGMGMTVESASDRVLRALRKGFTARDVHAAAEIVRRRRIPCLWIVLLGGPGETEDTVRETLRFVEREVRPRDAVFINVGIRVYPGTAIETIARAQGVLTAPREEMLRPVFHVSPALAVCALCPPEFADDAHGRVKDEHVETRQPARTHRFGRHGRAAVQHGPGRGGAAVEGGIWRPSERAEPGADSGGIRPPQHWQAAFRLRSAGGTSPRIHR